ncbi:MAG: ABC transporter ATP-binding protein [Mollicutes bacterium]|jgi:NitT/TauT family transport system ATP-binding protein|nr:ABC transporter ATP-binding protein [Mollicutes bacterium]
MNKILSIKNLKKIYHTKQGETLAVDNFSFNLLDGEFVAIVGPSGCGKSTILSILCGLEKKSDGEIKIRDNCKIGYMLQQDSLFNWRTILRNCLLGIEITEDLNDENKQHVINLLETYGLKDFINSYPQNLSGGMRQRVALIRTLATKPDILLLDEPFSALDYQSRLAVSDDVYRIIKSEHKSVIMVTHDIAEAISMADRIIVMTKRPGTIKNIYNIELTNKSTPIENRKAKEFAHYYELIWKDLDFHV